MAGLQKQTIAYADELAALTDQARASKGVRAYRNGCARFHRNSTPISYSSTGRVAGFRVVQLFELAQTDRKPVIDVEKGLCRWRREGAAGQMQVLSSQCSDRGAK